MINLMSDKICSFFLLICILTIGVSLFSVTEVLSANSTFFPQKESVIFLGPIAPDGLSIHIRSGTILPGKQIRYEQRAGDRVITDDLGNHWLLRAGKKIGSLVDSKKYLMLFDTVVTPRLSGKDLDTAKDYKLTSLTGVNRRASVYPVDVYRKSKPVNLGRTAKELVGIVEHFVYLQFPKDLVEGVQYTLSFGVDLDLEPISFLYNSRKMRSEAVHVSHLGFRPDSQAKVGFLSLWMGSGGGVDYNDIEMFEILEETSGRKVFNGKVSLEKSSSLNDEDFYNKNYNGTNVYSCDFSAFEKPGKYRLYIEGVGCSYPFSIKRTSLRGPFYKMLRAFYLQRSGIDKKPPYTKQRYSRAFHPDDGTIVYSSNTPLEGTCNGFRGCDDNFIDLLAGKTERARVNSWGGYFDAGDWDRRIQHLAVSNALLDLYSFFPGFFSTFSLNIPESGDGLPDIVDEALWGLDFFSRMQDSDGGVRGGIESEEHPKYGETSWQHSHEIYAYAPGVWSSYLYAAAASRASWVLSSVDSSLASRYRQQAVKAYAWAEHRYAKKDKEYSFEVIDARNLASAALYRCTGEKKYDTIFLKTTVFTKHDMPLRKDEKYEQGDAAWIYAGIQDRDVNQEVWINCRKAIIQQANVLLVAQQDAGYKWMKDPARPPFAGAFTIPLAKEIVWAYFLTKEKKYIRGAELATLTGSGANPLNMSYITGTGYKSPENLLHMDSRITGQKVPDGITVLGPLDNSFLGGKDNPYHKIVAQYCYPEISKWPVIESYWDVFWYPMMCEYTIDTMSSNIYIWGLITARDNFSETVGRTSQVKSKE